MEVTDPIKIIYQTAEDGLADTIKPRLESAGAECENILVIDESDKLLSMTDERLEEASKIAHQLYLVEREIEKRKNSRGENLEELYRQRDIYEKQLREYFTRWRI